MGLSSHSLANLMHFFANLVSPQYTLRDTTMAVRRRIIIRWIEELLKEHDGEWLCVTIVRNKKYLRLYVDGHLWKEKKL
jgi:hypothetical protein